MPNIRALYRAILGLFSLEKGRMRGVLIAL